MKRVIYPSLFERQPKLAKVILLLFILIFILWVIMPFIVFQNKKVLSELETDYRKLNHPVSATLISYETFYKAGTSLVNVEGEFQTTTPFNEIVNKYDTQLTQLGWVFLKKSEPDVNGRWYVLYCKGYWLSTKIEQKQNGYLVFLGQGYNSDCSSGNTNPWNAFSMLICFSPFFVLGFAAIVFSISSIRRENLKNFEKAKSGWAIFVGIFFVLLSSIAIYVAVKSLIWYLFTP